MWPFRRKKTPLSGVPARRRVKNYAAESGLDVRYWFCGKRQAGDVEHFVFECRFGAEQPKLITVRLLKANIGPEHSAAERYAIAKLSLFRAWDAGIDAGSLEPNAQEVLDHLRTIGRIE